MFVIEDVNVGRVVTADVYVRELFNFIVESAVVIEGISIV